MDVRIGLWRKLSAKELMLLNCGVGEDFESPLDCKEVQPVHSKGDQSCSLEGLMLKLKLQYLGHLMWTADLFEKTLMLWKIEGRVEGDDRGWDGWMASLTQWTRVWVDSSSWWWTGRPGMLRFMQPQSQTRLSDWTDWLRRREIINEVSWGKPANLAYSR